MLVSKDEDEGDLDTFQLGKFKSSSLLATDRIAPSVSGEHIS